MREITHLLFDILVSEGINTTVATYINMFVLLILLLVIVFIIDFITRKILIATFSRFATKSKTSFDDMLISNKAPRNIAHIIPLLLAIEFVPFVLSDFTYTKNVIQKALLVFGIVLMENYPVHIFLWTKRRILLCAMMVLKLMKFLSQISKRLRYLQNLYVLKRSKKK